MQIKYIENHITYSNEKVYQQIQHLVETNRYLNMSKIPDELNFINFLKMKYYQKTGFVPLCDREMFTLIKNPQTKKCKVRIKNFKAMDQGQTSLKKVAQTKEPVTPGSSQLRRRQTMRFRSKRGILIMDRAPYWMRCFFIQMNSRARFMIDLGSFLNLFYIAIAISLQVGFGVKMNAGLAAVELLSILYSCFVVLASLRTPVMVKGEATLKLRQVFRYQMQNGLIFDFIGCLPFNLIFGLLDLTTNTLLWAFIRCIRIAAAWKSIELFSHFEIYLKHHSLFLAVFKAMCVLFFLCHFVACMWNFV